MLFCPKVWKIKSNSYICSIRIRAGEIPALFGNQSIKFKLMRNIKRKDINPDKLITKSEYARSVGITPAAVQKQIDTGKLTIVVAKGTELIYAD